jgi:hypothetical protein
MLHCWAWIGKIIPTLKCVVIFASCDDDDIAIILLGIRFEEMKNIFQPFYHVEKFNFSTQIFYCSAHSIKSSHQKRFIFKHKLSAINIPHSFFSCCCSSTIHFKCHSIFFYKKIIPRNYNTHYGIFIKIKKKTKLFMCWKKQTLRLIDECFFTRKK